MTEQQVFDAMRGELIRTLANRFGAKNFDTQGKKALRVKGITGSRAEVDVVPSINYHFVRWLPQLNRYDTVAGVAILSADGRWTMNFPDQHYANGVAKRASTAHRFKRVVRILKRMRSYLTEHGLLTVKVPSFLVECLVYLVANEHFLVETDDRYDRVRRIVRRMQTLLANQLVIPGLVEINGVKLLFHPTQSWTYADAVTFINAVVAQLGRE
jgi:hypothetical protein